MIVGEVKAGRPIYQGYWRDGQAVGVWLPRVRVNGRRTLLISGDSPSGLHECETREEAVQWARDFAECAMREIAEIAVDMDSAALEGAKVDG